MVELFRSPRRLLLLVFEVALVTMLVLVAGCVRWGFHGGLTYPYVAEKALLFALVMGASFYYSGLYDFGATRTTRAAFERVLKSLPFGVIALLSIFYALPFLELGRGTLLLSLALTTIVLPSWRHVYYRFAGTGGWLKRTLILGNGELAREVAAMIRTRGDFGLELVGILARDRNQVNPIEGVIGIYRDLFEIVMREEIHVVLVAYPDRRGTLPVEQLLEVKFRGIEVREGLDFYEREARKIFVRELKPSQLIFSVGFTARTTTRRLKRMIDVASAIIGLILASPLMLLTAIAIKFESNGPILYKQVRAGEFGRLFTILKFRSMHTDAERLGAQYARVDDARVTRVGRFIRRTRLDEMPQLWNVLKGEMSMVGPRPERPIFIEQLEQQVPYFKQRLYVKPGLTGHAQVRGRYGASADDMLEKLQYDLYYIKSYSVLFDLSIMFDTIKVIILRMGAR
jgi:sugar transferase (PEP-CTERM system associated)